VLQPAGDPVHRQARAVEINLIVSADRHRFSLAWDGLGRQGVVHRQRLYRQDGRLVVGPGPGIKQEEQERGA
jgi:hypothetical protein